MKFQQFSYFSLWSVFKTSFSLSSHAQTMILLHGYFHQTCFVHALIDLGLCGELLTKKERFQSMLCAACENRIFKTSLVLPVTISLTNSTKRMHVETLSKFQTVCVPTQVKLNCVKMANRIVAGSWSAGCQIISPNLDESPE